jgi:putative ABC transport system permease protein
MVASLRPVRPYAAPGRRAKRFEVAASDAVMGHTGPMATSIEWWQAAISLVLVAIAVGLSVWQRLGIERRIVVAAARAAVQLLAVGFVLRFIIESSFDDALAVGWVVMMVVISGAVTRRRAPQIPGGAGVAIGVIGLTTAVCLGVIFGLDVIDYAPITFVVIAGITIGNTMPSVVLGAQRLIDTLSERRGHVEALLALGFDRKGVVRQIGGPIVRLALVPQIERTNVVGLIALPGAMTGLLLAGVDPIDAVLLQLVVMYLVLGSVAVSVSATVTIGLRRALTADLRLADWSLDPPAAGH